MKEKCTENGIGRLATRKHRIGFGAIKKRLI
jgi:hypothetical protein